MYRTDGQILIGAALGDFARLERMLDEYLCEICKRWPSMVGQRIIPLQFSRKIDFLINCYVKIPKLRMFGLTDNSLDLNRIGYRLEEIFDHRNQMAHGDHHFSYTHNDGDLEISFYRLVRDKEVVGGLAKAIFVTYKSFVLYLRRTSWMLADFFDHAKKFVRGELSNNFWQEEGKKQSRQKEWWEQEGQYLGFEDSPFLPLIRGDFA